MAFAVPLIASLVAPSLASAAGLGISSTLASAIGSGLATWGMTGDIKKGLLGGLMGYGVGSIANAAASSGAGLANTGAGAAGVAGATTPLAQGLQLAPGLTAGANTAQALTNGAMAGGITPLIQQAASPSLIAGLNPAQALTQSAIPNAGSLMGGANMWASNPMQALNYAGQGLAHDPSLLLKGGLPLLLGMQGLEPDPETPDMASGPKLTHTRSLNPYTPMQAMTAPAGYRPGHDPEFNYFGQGYAKGGKVDTAANKPVTKKDMDRLLRHLNVPRSWAVGGVGSENLSADDLISSYMANNNTGGIGYAQPLAEMAANKMGADAPQMESNFFEDRIRRGVSPADMRGLLNNYARGGKVAKPHQLPGVGWLHAVAQHSAMPYPKPVSGPKRPKAIHFANGTKEVVGRGDGSSDDVVAMIDGHAPARLSSGEAVISSDVVSHLGNGDSRAGHRAIREMVDRVRKMKTGTSSMPRRLHPLTMMPA